MPQFIILDLLSAVNCMSQTMASKEKQRTLWIKGGGPGGAPDRIPRRPDV